jgi:poly(A) polymerase
MNIVGDYLKKRIIMKNDILLLQHPIYNIVRKVAEEKKCNSYAVGGVVRDLFLNRFSKDIDILVMGSGIEFAQAVAKDISPTLDVNLFKNFGTAQFVYEDAAIEFVGARKESYDFNSRKPTVENGTLEDDLSRRDFTINAMAIGISGEMRGELVDIFNGFEDLQAKILRTPLDPDITFSDDPLRMMRAVRFASQLGFTIEPKTLAAIERNAHRLEIISKERIMDEFNKILLSKKPSVGIKLCEETGLIAQFLPELLALKGVEKMNGVSHKENYLHTLQVVDKIALVNSNLWLLWAALLHDIAKPQTKKYDEKVGWSFHGHEYIGSKMVKRIFNTLKMPTNEKMRYVQKLVALHLRPIALVEDEITDSAVRRLLFDAGDDIDDLMMLCEADVTSSVPEKIKRCMENFANVRNKLKEIEEKDRIRNWQPPIDGELIMQTFQLKPCREVGLIKDAIREAILDGKIPNEFSPSYNLMIEEGEKLGLLRNSNLNRKEMPQIQSIKTCELQAPLIETVSNSIPVFLFQNPNLDLIHILLKVKAGPLYEPVKFVANATWQLIKESNATYSANEMDDFLACHGTSWKTGIHTQFIAIQWIIPKRNMEKVLPVLWKTISNPCFRNDDLQRFKESRIKDLEYNQVKFNYRATQLMFAEMFPSNIPIGTILTKEHIKNITIKQLQDYHQQIFTENSIRIFITGNPGDEIMRRFGDEMIEAESRKQKAVGKKEKPEENLALLRSCALTVSKIIEPREGALQSSFILCKKKIGYAHEERRNFEILSVLYGGYFGSRLMQNLREENGYTYGVFCSSLFYENDSIFYIEADVEVDKTKEAIDECFNEMKLLQNELVSEEELALVKSYMLGELLREVDGSVSYQKKYAYWNDFQLDEKEMQQMIDTLHNITPQKIQTLAKQYLVPEIFTMVVVGKM